MAPRVHYRRMNKYNTASNKKRTVRTPGARTVLQHVKKSGIPSVCSNCKDKLRGLPPLRPCVKHRTAKKDLTVSRPYGGMLCHKCVRHKIVRAFLMEEQKCVRLVLKEKDRQKKADAKKDRSTGRKRINK